MAGLFLNLVSLAEEIQRCRHREVEERAAAASASDSCTRDAHLALAKCYADRAMALANSYRPPVIPSGRWPIAILPEVAGS